MNLSISYFFRAVARAKPPKKRKIIGCAKEENAALTLKTPKREANIGTNSDVTGNGRASVIQRTAVNMRIDSPFLTSNGMLKAKGIKQSIKAKGMKTFFFIVPPEVVPFRNYTTLYSALMKEREKGKQH
jgi:hypothetical protein